MSNRRSNQNFARLFALCLLPSSVAQLSSQQVLRTALPCQCLLWAAGQCRMNIERSTPLQSRRGGSLRIASLSTPARGLYLGPPALGMYAKMPCKLMKPFRVLWHATLDHAHHLGCVLAGLSRYSQHHLALRPGQWRPVVAANAESAKGGVATLEKVCPRFMHHLACLRCVF